MLLKILYNLLHVALQVICEGLLVLESSFNETVVKHDVNARLCSLLGTFVSLFSRSVGSGKNDLALSTGLVLRSRKNQVESASASVFRSSDYSNSLYANKCQKSELV